ncbi:MAG: hypothetical protein JXQ65_09275 [Candidatus Marinimicrobia bacterium]|nr:hypothetical protein [Candidatus Neomarinimicrobiota bacterium]
MLRRSSILWIISIILTLVFVVYQKKTGPTYPVKGQKIVADSLVTYKFYRSYDVGKQVPIKIKTNHKNITAYFVHKRLKSHDEWSTKIYLERENESLVGYLPTLNELAGKRVYKVYLNDKMIGDEPIIIRFKGNVPAYILIPHILFMFIAMLVSTRAGLEVIFRNVSTDKLTRVTSFSLLLGGIILGPIVQKFAFDAFWTGWPLGHDLTDNKTLLAMIFWGIALWKARKNHNPRFWVLIAFIILTLVYLVPHSMLGSEFDYR